MDMYKNKPVIISDRRVAQALTLNFGCPVFRFLKGRGFDFDLVWPQLCGPMRIKPESFLA